MLQPADYIAVHPCRPPAEQEDTSRTCGSLSALYSCGFLLIRTWYQVVIVLSNPAICKAGRGSLLLCDACCHRYNNAAAAVRFSWAAGCGREFQPLLRCILFYFCKYYPTTLRTACCLPCVTRVRAVCHPWSALKPFFICSPRLCAREVFFAVSATTKACNSSGPCVTRVSAVCHAWSAFKPYFCLQSSILCGRGLLCRGRHNKDMQ